MIIIIIEKNIQKYNKNKKNINNNNNNNNNDIIIGIKTIIRIIRILILTKI